MLAYFFILLLKITCDAVLLSLKNQLLLANVLVLTLLLCSCLGLCRSKREGEN